MFLSTLKKLLLPLAPRPVRILRGPFRGATICMSPRENLRKVFGLYEHELNGWLKEVLPRVDAVLDIGANNGYFAFGCAAAFRRMHKPGRVVVFEPSAELCEQLAFTAGLQPQNDGIVVSIEQTLVGGTVNESQTTLDAFARRVNGTFETVRTLVKIDVEGAELGVIEGAKLWLDPSNYFLIEVHQESYLPIVQARFAAASLPLEQINQKQLPLLGREQRSMTNWWLVSRLS